MRWNNALIIAVSFLIALSIVYVLIMTFSSKTNQLPQDGIASSESTWTTCTNQVGKYSFKYPSDWHVFDYGIGSAEETDCNSAPANFVINPHAPLASIKGQIEFYFIQGAGLKSPPKSLNDYLAAEPKILEADKLVMNGALGGERAVWLQEPNPGVVAIYCWHNGNILKIVAEEVNDAELHAILNTFEFDK